MPITISNGAGCAGSCAAVSSGCETFCDGGDGSGGCGRGCGD